MDIEQTPKAIRAFQKVQPFPVNPLATDEQIEMLAATWKRMRDVTQSQIINPIIKEQAKRN